MSRAVARAMIDQATGGAIVNIGSILGQQAVAGDAAYAASKAGVSLLTQTLALELAPLGVRVNTIAPGNMATDMHFDWLRALAQERGVPLEEEVEAMRRSIPLGRHGVGDDIAGAVAWLISDDAAYVTGQTIGVNRGSCCREQVLRPARSGDGWRVGHRSRHGVDAWRTRRERRPGRPRSRRDAPRGRKSRCARRHRRRPCARRGRSGCRRRFALAGWSSGSPGQRGWHLPDPARS